MNQMVKVLFAFLVQSLKKQWSRELFVEIVLGKLSSIGNPLVDERFAV